MAPTRLPGVSRHSEQEAGSFLCLPSVVLRAFHQFLVACSCFPKSQLTIMRPSDLSLPPIVQLAPTAKLADPANKVICLGTVNLNLVEEDVSQGMVSLCAVSHSMIY